MCVPAFVFGRVIILLGGFIPSWAALVELPLEPPSPPSGAAGDPTALIADPGLRTSVYPGVCSDIRVGRGTRTTLEICTKLGGAGGVAAQAAVSRRCGSDGAGLIASAVSGSRRLRQTQ